MNDWTTFGVGGDPERLERFDSAQQYLDAFENLGQHRVIGGGSNILVSDRGPSGTVAILARAGSGVVEVSARSVLLDAAGCWHETVLDLGARNLAGVESLVGIPGTVGGAVVQNIGAYGTEICEVISRVSALVVDTGELVSMTAAQCSFGYRDSRFKSIDRGEFVVTAVELDLGGDDAHVPRYEELGRRLEQMCGKRSAYPTAAVRDAVLTARRSKNMVWSREDPESWGAGSFFVNPIVDETVADRMYEVSGGAVPSWPSGAGRRKLAAGALVEQAGFERGYRWQRVGLAKGHALGLVNVSGEASASDVVGAANEVATAVHERFGVRLAAEPVFVGFDRDIELAFDAHIEP